MTAPLAPSPMRGIVYSWAQVREAPGGFEAQAPYQLALVKLDDGNLICAQLTDYVGEAQIGDPVEMVTRKLTTDGERGMIVYGYKFRPLIQ
ncbi:MAG: OB-fold domain-containing protein [Chloroflexi bacterium]|nr:OB-fold domain-containing protein [Chloroflexota bacterium]MCY4246862.1 OB-fold domain-containing protein [Chloroflexota bacterium]